MERIEASSVAPPSTTAGGAVQQAEGLLVFDGLSPQPRAANPPMVVFPAFASEPPCAANAADQVTEGHRRGRANDPQTAMSPNKADEDDCDCTLRRYVFPSCLDIALQN